MASTTPKPTILFIHGAWHTPVHYRVFLDLLQAKGYDVVAPELPSNHFAKFEGDAANDPSEADVQYFAGLARELADQGKEIVCVMHSYGGAVGTEAMVGLGLETRKKQGLEGGVKRLVYICAFMVEKGKSLEDTAPASSVGWVEYTDHLKVFVEGSDVGGLFYPDLSKEEQQKWVAQLVPHHKAGSFRRPTAVAYDEVPTTFVYCERDAAFPLFAQHATIAAHKANGVKVDEATLPAGHFPNLSMPKELASVVLQWV